jgi:hypothetical protein
MNMPGFTAESSLGPAMHTYQGNVVPGRRPVQGVGGVLPQLLRFGGDPDLGEYLRCRANGGGDLVCRFFGGLPPFTIGGLLF